MSGRGGGFFIRVLEQHFIGEPAGQLLEEIAHILDSLDGLQSALDQQDLVQGGRPSPILIELRQQRQLLGKLLSLLPPAAEVPGQAPPPSPRSLQARKAAETRWAEHRRNRGAVS